MRVEGQINKINIIGASGSGKTTLGQALAQRLKLPFFDTDFYFHEQTDPPFQIQRPPQERCSLIENDLGVHPSWVLSGAIGHWVPTPIVDCTMYVFLYLKPELRLTRLKQRESRLYGHRIEAGGDMEDTHREFMDWTAGYDVGTCAGTNTLSHHELILSRAKCPIIRFEKSMSTEDQMKEILKTLGFFN